MSKKSVSNKREKELKDFLARLKGKILADVRKTITDHIDDDIRLSFEVMKDNADKSVDELLKHVNAAVVGNKSEMLDKIDEAVAKIENGTYGICEECGREIPLARLKVVAFATCCVACQTKEEKKPKEGTGPQQKSIETDDSINLMSDDE